MTDYGIRDDFTRKLGETIPQGFSALFVARSMRLNRIANRIEGVLRPRRAHVANLSSNAFASFKSNVSKPSVNQP